MVEVVVVAYTHIHTAGTLEVGTFTLERWNVGTLELGLWSPPFRFSRIVGIHSHQHSALISSDSSDNSCCQEPAKNPQHSPNIQLTNDYNNDYWLFELSPGRASRASRLQARARFSNSNFETRIRSNVPIQRSTFATRLFHFGLSASLASDASSIINHHSSFIIHHPSTIDHRLPIWAIGRGVHFSAMSQNDTTLNMFVHTILNKNNIISQSSIIIHHSSSIDHRPSPIWAIGNRTWSSLFRDVSE